MRSPGKMKDVPENGIILYRTEDARSEIRLYSRDGNVWLNQLQIAELFAVSKPNVSVHISKILREGELDEKSVVKYYLTTAADGKDYSVAYYSLELVLAVGYRVRSVLGMQFRQWATRHLAEYLQKGFVIDTRRLENPDGRPDFFDELLAEIRRIRASEKRFYQKIRDLFSLSSDYVASDQSTQLFFAEVQNKLLYAVTEKTAAEIIVSRADAGKPNMGMTTWSGNVVRKTDVIIAKNYLTKDEVDTLNRLVVIFLETAELHVKLRRNLTLDFWRENVDKILNNHQLRVLTGAGTVSASEMKRLVSDVYEKFDASRRAFEARQADALDEEELKRLEEELKKGGAR